MPGPTLDDLEGIVWCEPNYHSSLVETCHRLRKKPIADFTPADLRIMIGQRIGLPHLLPKAIALLESDPLLNAFYYPGDLLAAAIESGDWIRSQSESFAKLVAIVRLAVERLGDEEELRRRLIDFLELAGQGY